MTNARPSPPAGLGPIWKRKYALTARPAEIVIGAVTHADAVSFATASVSLISEFCASNAFWFKVHVVSAVGKLQKFSVTAQARQGPKATAMNPIEERKRRR